MAKSNHLEETTRYQEPRTEVSDGWVAGKEIPIVGRIDDFALLFHS
jgi:hypothetical protein